jgi:hypothetical protein
MVRSLSRNPAMCGSSLYFMAWLFHGLGQAPNQQGAFNAAE